MGLYFLFGREPQYQGKSLSEWLDDLGGPSGNQVEAQAAIRHMGRASIPFLTGLLKSRPSQAPFKSKLTDWLNDHPSIPIHLPMERDRSQLVVAAFGALGSAGKPATVKLAGMLVNKDISLSSDAARCLAAIGPESIPVLTNALARNTNVIVRACALFAIGELGTAAKATAPLLGSLIHDTNWGTAGGAIRDLGEMGDVGELYAPRFETMLFDTNVADAAAFALARLGPSHTDAMVRALADPNTVVKVSAIAGLSPRLCRSESRRQDDPPTYSFHEALEEFNSRKYWAEIYFLNLHSSRGVLPNLQNVLLGNLDHPDVKVRAATARLLGERGPAGFGAIPALESALKDSSEAVRQSAAEALARIDVETRGGGIVRGPKNEKKIALEFTGHTFGEGGQIILAELAQHKAKASFFLTGDFLVNPNFKPFIDRMISDGHYIGPHSDKHLLYCSWDVPKKTLVTKAAFEQDLVKNFQKLWRFHVRSPVLFWLPAYEQYNQDIVDWSRERGYTLVNYTPGTRSNADYTEESAANFVSSREILNSIYKKEREDPHGLNGFLLLMHIGAGPGRKDKLADHLGELLDQLSAKGYQFVRVDELLNPK